MEADPQSIKDVTYTAIFLAKTSLAGAIASMIAAWVNAAQKKAAITFAETAKALSDKAGITPSTSDLAKLIDAAKGLVEALGKAGPVAAWLAASILFLGVAAFNVSDHSHSPVPPKPAVTKPGVVK